MIIQPLKRYICKATRPYYLFTPEHQGLRLQRVLEFENLSKKQTCSTCCTEAIDFPIKSNPLGGLLASGDTVG